MTLDDLAAKLRGRRSGHGWSCHCPSHDDKSPSLWISAKDDGSLFVKCQAGCSSEQVLAALDQKGWLNGFKSFKPATPLSKDQHKRQKFLDECIPVWGTVGEKYLQGRGLTALPPSVVFHPKAKELMGIWYPAIVAKVQRPDGVVTSYQCTYLKADGSDAREIFGAKRRQTFGSLEGGAVVFPGAVTPMVIAESWETAATVWEATGRMVLAALGLTNASKLELPDGAEVWLAGEADEPGSQAAETQTKVIASLQRKKHIVRVMTPTPYAGIKGTDWSDVAQREGLGAVTAAWTSVPDKVKTPAELAADAANHTAEVAAGMDDTGGTAGGSSGNGADWLLDLNKKHAVVMVGGKTRIMNEEPNAEGDLETTYSSAEDFRLRYNNQQVTMFDAAGNAAVVRKGDGWLNSPARRQYDAVVMWPGNKDKRFYNLWRGFAFEPKPGNWDLFKQHILDNVVSGVQEHFEYLLGWMAWGVQKLNVKPEVAIVLQGGKGTGKTFFADAYGKIFGRHYLTVSDRRHLVGNFNRQLQDKVLVFGDEAVWAGDRQAESPLKTMITSKTMRIESKGVDVVEIKSCHRVILASNADWVVPASFDERRFAAFRLSEAQKQNGAYFKAIDKQMADGGYEAMLHELLEMDISGYDPRDVPVTEALTEQKIVSMDPLYQWWQDKLLEGTLAIENFEFGKRVPVIWLHHDYLRSTSKLRKNYLEDKVSFGRKFKQMLETGSKGKWKAHQFEMRYRMPDMRDDALQRMTCRELPTLEAARKWFEVLIKAPVDWEASTMLRDDEHPGYLDDAGIPF